MSKRSYFPLQQGGERKRAKLDVSISDHNFPLSQNKEQEQTDNWGDDNDDEILLLASQVCEEVYNNDLSMLPEYSMFAQPGSSSTQISTPGPSTSKDFTFKKPLPSPTSIISTNLKEKCNRISSPLPGITAQMMPKANTPHNGSDSLFNDKIYKGHDSEQIYRQLLQLQEENEKLKSENGKLLEKCVTKEGEASILRTQLKTCQVAVDNARLEKIKAQENVQREWTDKLTAASNQMHDLRTQLDFKNLEIISIKEKCKKLESTKVKLTQVTVSNNDISANHRASSSFSHNDTIHNKRVKTASNAVQTEGRANFLTLNEPPTTGRTHFSSLLPYIIEPTSTPHSILEHNEKLTTHVPHKCRVFSTFHKIPSSSVVNKHEGSNVSISDIYEDVVKIASGSDDKEVFYRVFIIIQEVLAGVVSRLEVIKQRMTTAFQKEMDERYIESTYSFIDVTREDLLRGRALYKDEQEILARRLCTILSYILELPNCRTMFQDFEILSPRSKVCVKLHLRRIWKMINETSCATIYSGLLKSMTYLYYDPYQSYYQEKIFISSRPMPIVSIRVMYALLNISSWSDSMYIKKNFCHGQTSDNNLKIDYDQGVLLFKDTCESCYFLILSRQIEVALKCIEEQHLWHRAAEVTRNLISLYYALFNFTTFNVHDKTKCDCNLVMIQVIVYALRVCAVILQNSCNGDGTPSNLDLLSVCRCGIHLLYVSTLSDLEFCSILAHNEGHMIEFCEIMRGFQHSEFHMNMLSELTSTLQSTPEDMPPSFHRQPWLKSFETFSITD